MKTLIFTPEEICHCIRHINCMNQDDFLKVFDDHNYYWKKFTEDYKRNISKFLMYLDYSGQDLIFEHCRSFLDRNKS